MKTIIFFLMIIGSVLIFTGLLELEFNRKKKCKNVEYRVVPRNIYDSIKSDNKLQDEFNFMFDANDVRNSTNLVC
jgi:hypothetical protein